MMGILQEALLEDDLVKLGIVLHAYADTFSHQGFSGLLSKVNDIEQVQILKGSGIVVDKFKYILKWIKDAVSEQFDLLIPAYGHGQAMVYPDLPYLIWQYDENLKFLFVDKRRNGEFTLVETESKE